MAETRERDFKEDQAVREELGFYYTGDLSEREESESSIAPEDLSAYYDFVCNMCL